MWILCSDLYHLKFQVPSEWVQTMAFFERPKYQKQIFVDHPTTLSYNTCCIIFTRNEGSHNKGTLRHNISYTQPHIHQPQKYKKKSAEYCTCTLEAISHPKFPLNEVGLYF